MLLNPLVYLIDDDEVNYFLVKTILEDAYPACQVICFCDAEEALQALKEAKNSDKPFPALILLDLHLPPGDGWYFVEQYEVLAANSSPPGNVFILTCSTHPRDIGKAKEYTCIADFLIKPFTEELAKNKLNTFLQGSKQVLKANAFFK
jgi:CheY-like chemotaxis protein